MRLLKHTCIMVVTLFLCACSSKGYQIGYYLHNTTGHDITIVNTKSRVYGKVKRDSVVVENNEYYFLCVQAPTKKDMAYYSLLNVESMLYFYTNDTCYYIHPGDSYGNCLWKDSYKQATKAEKELLSERTNYILDWTYIYDLTDENIKTENHRP